VSNQKTYQNKILVTGASGFIGRFLCRELASRGYDFRAAVRLNGASFSGFEEIAVGLIDLETDWSKALNSVSVVVHLAARVHVMNDQETDPLSAFRKVNVDGTLNLARQAASIGVKRFIYLSSIKVNGEFTNNQHAFSHNDAPNPQDAYSQSKAEAEEGLRLLAIESRMEVVIIRPPLVYGPGVKANFLRMLKFLERGIPLPFGLINNSRSLVGIDNLVDLIALCIKHPSAANQTFLVSDNQDVSTRELLKKIGAALGRPARLVPVPTELISLCFFLLGRRDLSLRLFSSLRVDISKTQKILGWSPPVSLDQGLKRLIDYKG
jgi:nucleoside-diphosphate-sugar epimerase